MTKPFWIKGRSLLHFSDNKAMIVFAVCIGGVDGGAAAILIKLINQVGRLANVQEFGRFITWRPLLTVLVPALGGLLAGWVIQLLHHSAEKTGVSEVIFALRKNNGHIPTRLTLAKMLASAFTVGSGGSAGPEAPVALIGGGVGSMFAHFRHLSVENRKVLVSAGAAGGLAAVFNTPVAAVIFAMEVLLSQFASSSFAVIVLTTVTASVFSHILLGQRTYFPVLSYGFNHPSEMGFYLLLGAVCAPVAKTFQWVYHRFEDLFDGWTGISRPWKTMIGGMGVGVIAVFIPQVISDGHLVVTPLLMSNLYQGSMAFLFLLLVAKIVATSLTVASGGSGGTMVPAMFVGAMTGMIFGQCVHGFFPSADPGAYGVIGMAAVLAGITHAPFTAIMMLFELTRDYDIILPLMFTVGVTMILARWLHAEGIEQRELQRKGVEPLS